jgi:hypothetical protein
MFNIKNWLGYIRRIFNRALPKGINMIAYIKLKSYFFFSLVILAIVIFSTIAFAANFPLEIIQPRAGLDTTNRSAYGWSMGFVGALKAPQW